MKKSKKIWTEEECLYLKKNWSKKTIKYLSLYLKISEEEVIKQSSRMHLGIHTLSKDKCRKWEQEEIDFIINHKNQYTLIELAEILNRTDKAIYAKLNRLKLNDYYKKDACNIQIWSKEEETLLIKNWDKMSVDNLAQLLNRSIEQIQKKAKRLNLNSKKSDRHWTQEQIDFLEDYFGNLDIKTLSRKLNKSPTAIKMKANRLNLFALSNTKYFSASRVAFLLKVYPCQVINRWIRLLGLKAKYLNVTSKFGIWCIELNDLFRWMEKHPEEWHIHNLEPYAFGLEPDWIKQLRRENQLKNYPIHKVIK